MLACDAVRSRRIASPTGKPKTIAAVHPNAGLEVAYRKKLDALIHEMNASLVYWLKATYRAKPPEMAQDAPDGSLEGSPAMRLRTEMWHLGDRWLKRFDDAAPDLARYFATAAAQRADGALAAALKKAGISVRFKMTAPMNDAYRAVIGENISLIKSIAQEHLAGVEQMVMRSVTAGRDIGALAKGLDERYGATRRRAALIARDQNAKATAVVTRVRQVECGITEAIWLHSTGGRHPRKSHQDASGKRYNVAEGMLIDGEHIRPGELINCRCVCRSVVEGFE